MENKDPSRCDYKEAPTWPVLMNSSVREHAKKKMCCVEHVKHCQTMLNNVRQCWTTSAQKSIIRNGMSYTDNHQGDKVRCSVRSLPFVLDSLVWSFVWQSERSIIRTWSANGNNDCSAWLYFVVTWHGLLCSAIDYLFPSNGWFDTGQWRKIPLDSAIKDNSSVFWPVVSIDFGTPIRFLLVILRLAVYHRLAITCCALLLPTAASRYNQNAVCLATRNTQSCAFHREMQLISCGTLWPTQSIAPCGELSLIFYA